MTYFATRTLTIGFDDLKSIDVTYAYRVTPERAFRYSPKEPPIASLKYIRVGQDGYWLKPPEAVADLILSLEPEETLSAWLLAEAAKQAREAAEDAADHAGRLRQDK